MDPQYDFDDAPLADLTYSSLLQNRAEAIGDQRALVYGPEERELTFSELNEVANRIGNGLLELGMESQEKVSVMTKSPFNAVRSMVGINKCGTVYSPINFEYKGEALSYQINDTNPEILILEDRYNARLNAIYGDIKSVPQVVTIETDAESDPLIDEFPSTSFQELLDASPDDPPVEVTWDDEASIVYTSGTTGMPKGVVIPYRWIFGNYTLFRQSLVNQDDVVHTSLPMYHVGGIYWDITTAWVAGAPVIIWDRFSPNEFWSRIDKYGASVTTLVSVMSTWLSKQEEGDISTTLNKVHMQPLPENYDEMAQRFGFDFVTVGFGQTESGFPVAGAIQAANRRNQTPTEVRKGKPPEAIVDEIEQLGVPVVDEAPGERFMGKPVSSIMEVTTLDERDEETDTGRAGELSVRPKRAGLILKEYYGKPDRTVSAFQNLWFHTGDAAYQDEDGFFYFVDRIGDVIRRRGENISSIQVQEIVNAHDGVATTAAFPVPAEEGGEDEVAIAVEKADADLLEDDLREHFEEEMPEFMHPKYILFVDSVPTTKTNKVEKYKLREHVVETEGLDA